MPPSPTKTSLNVGTSAMMMNLYECDLSCFLKQKCGEFYIFKQFSSLLKQCNSKRMYFCLSLFLSLSLSSCVFMRCVKFRLRIANCVEEGSYCRGGIVHIRGGRSRALFVWPQSASALWRFRASTSNSPSGRSWPHPHTHTGIDYNYSQKDI